jgi:hypothetical protein
METIFQTNAHSDRKFQGSVIRPTLFNVYGGDKPSTEYDNKIAVLMFADDLLMSVFGEAA